MPIAGQLSGPFGVEAAFGSSWTISLTSSKKLKSLACTPNKLAPAMLMNSVSGGAAASARE